MISAPRMTVLTVFIAAQRCAGGVHGFLICQRRDGFCGEYGGNGSASKLVKGIARLEATGITTLVVGSALLAADRIVDGDVNLSFLALVYHMHIVY